jgi:hypothetical protein
MKGGARQREGWTVNPRLVHRNWREEVCSGLPPEAQEGMPGLRVTAASPGRAPVPGLGLGLSARCHGRWPEAQVFERDQRIQPLFPCHSGAQGCNAKEVVVVLEELAGLYTPPAFIRALSGMNSSPTVSNAAARAAAPPLSTLTRFTVAEQLC